MKLRFLACSVVLVSAVTAAGAAFAAPALNCRIEQGDTVQDIRFTAVRDPYAVPSVDINKRFRFKAVMVGQASGIEYVKLYTYYQTRRQPVLLHMAKYLSPDVQPRDATKSLTGTVYLYSPDLEREIKYECALREEAR